jgi:folate-binding protein YgfZ
MTDWLQELEKERLTPRQTVGSPRDFFTSLDQLGHITFSGDDAATFLHNQLTNDVEHLGTDQARLAGYCSPKGRLLASLLIWRSADTVTLQLPRVLQAAIQKRLQMYVLRAKVKVADINEETVALGFAGTSAAAVLRHWFTELPAACYDKVDAPAGTLIRLADANDLPRWQWITTKSIASEALPTLCNELTLADAARWRLTDIVAALPQITLATQEKFVPQMINFEAIGGVNFKKGCYPGQEIVARSQYLGTLKRRMLPASVDAALVEPGMEVFAAADAAQPCGMIVNAERDADGRMQCLVEVKLAAHAAGNIHLGADGPVLQFSALPYSLPDAA